MTYAIDLRETLLDPPPMARCTGCGRTVKIRRTGAPGVVGTLHKHALPEGGPCPNSGKLPGPTNPKRRCYQCHTLVATHHNELLYRHRGNADPNAKNPLHQWCEGSGKPGYDETDNTTAPGTSGAESYASFAIGDGYRRRVDGQAAAPRRQYTAQEELARWWRAQTERQIDGLIAKAVDYGATDLRDLGLQMLELAGRRDSDTADWYATEVGIAFYAWGKLARIMAAVKEGRYPNSDSWYDLEIYAKMAQRVQSHGGWPGTPHAADLYIDQDEEDDQ